ncbi:MAG: hypothetical protein RR768_05665 [Clostridium sp.]
MKYVDETIKNEARKTNLIDYLQVYHPDKIIKKDKGQYAYTGNQNITFFKGKDDVWRYCDHKKRMQKKPNYCGDSIQFLQEYVGGYTFQSAVHDLYEFAHM